MRSDGSVDISDYLDKKEVILMSKVLVKECDLLLTGGSVVTIDDERKVFDPGAVAITGDRIIAVGSVGDLSEYRAKRTVNCAGKAIIPGFVDSHNHLFQSLARGLGEGMLIVPWLSQFMWPYGIAINSEEARIAATLGAIEAIRSGTTTVIDHHFAPTDPETTLAVASTIEDVGMRGAVARGIVGQKTKVAEMRGLPDGLFRYSQEEELEITRSCIEARPPGSKVEVWPAPLNIVYVDQDMVRRSVELAREYGVRWHTHCSEGRYDPDHYLKAYGIRPVEWLYQEGLLGPDAILAHGIWLNDQEVQRLGETGAGIAHNPVANPYLASGAIKLRDMRSQGVVVGIGTDGSSCGHRQDMFECMKQSIFIQRQQTLDPTSARCEEALEMATREGARFAGLDSGVLAPGKLADIAVVDLKKPHLTPLHRTVASLVYSARGSDVEMTIAGGQIIYEGGRCTLVDEEEIMREAQERAAHLVKRAKFEHLCEPWFHEASGVGIEIK